MSQKVVTTCDHCGAPANGNVYASLWDEGDETKPYKHTRLDGCTKEHLAFVVAKAFGIDINWTMVDAIEAKNLIIADRDKRIAEQDAAQAQMAAWRESERTKARTEIDAANARIAELETGFDYGILEATRNQRDLAEKRITDLEKQLAALHTNAPSFTDNTKPTKPLAGYPVCAECGQQKGPVGCWCDQRSK